MGIQDFWSIAESSGRNVSIESLRGKRLAVDISIWLNQIIRAARTKTGETVPNAHIYITVFRLCKLMYYGIKPVIVFDGDAPALKKRTLQNRREKASKADEKMKQIRIELLATEYMEQIKSNVYLIIECQFRMVCLRFVKNQFQVKMLLNKTNWNSKLFITGTFLTMR